MTGNTFPSLDPYNGHFVHPLLAVGGCPHPEHVPVFVAAGIRGIIDARACMLREHVIYIAHLPDTIRWQILGTWDGMYPNADWTARDPSGREPAKTTVCPHYMELIVERAAAMVRDHSPVLIHCGGGIGRSGNLAAIMYAALEDTTVDDALDRMRRCRPQLGSWSPERYPGTDAEKLIALARRIIRTDH